MIATLQYPVEARIGLDRLPNQDARNAIPLDRFVSAQADPARAVHQLRHQTQSFKTVHLQQWLDLLTQPVGQILAIDL